MKSGMIRYIYMTLKHVAELHLLHVKKKAQTIKHLIEYLIIWYYKNLPSSGILWPAYVQHYKSC